MSRLQGFRSYFLGVEFILAGGRAFLTSRWMWPYLIIPFVLNGMILIVGLWGAAELLPAFVKQLVDRFVSSDLNVLYSFSNLVLTLLLWIGFLVVFGYFLLIVGSFLNSPFLSFLAEKYLLRVGVLSSDKTSLSQWLSSSFKMLRVALIKLLVFAALGFMLFFTSFVPGLNLFSSFAASLIVAFDCMDYSFEAMGWDFKTRLSYFRQNLPLFCGMATVLTLTLLIPGLTLLIYPLAVIGATTKLAQLRRLENKT